MKKEFIDKLRANLGADLSQTLHGFGAWLNPRVVALEADGKGMILEQDLREEMLNPFGILHGGALAGMVDEALGFQLFLLNPPEEIFVAINLQIDFLRPGRPNSVLTLKPEVVRKGRNTAFLRCEVYDATGRLMASASSHFAKFSS